MPATISAIPSNVMKKAIQLYTPNSVAMKPSKPSSLFLSPSTIPTTRILIFPNHLYPKPNLTNSLVISQLMVYRASSSILPHVPGQTPPEFPRNPDYDPQPSNPPEFPNPPDEIVTSPQPPDIPENPTPGPDYPVPPLPTPPTTPDVPQPPPRMRRPQPPNRLPPRMPPEPDILPPPTHPRPDIQPLDDTPPDIKPPPGPFVV